MGAGCSPGAEQPSSCTGGCQHPSCLRRVPLLCHAAPHGLPFPRVCVGWGGLVGGAKGAWQRLCSGGAWGLTAWYLLGRQGTEAKVVVLAPAFPLALYRQAPKCQWCRRAGCCVSRQGMAGGTGCAPTPDSGCPFQLGSVARATPPRPTGLTMKVLGCVCAGAQSTMGKGPDAPLSFLPWDNVPAWPGD